MFNSRLLASAAALSLLAGAAQAQTALTFHLVGALPGSNTFSSGYGVSEDGSVVVGHSGNNYYYGSSSHAFRWSSDTGIVDLDPLAPAAGAYGVSADGQVIVGSEISGSAKAVRWGAQGSSLVDQLYHGGECYGLSRDGAFAVGYSASGGGGGGGGGAFRPHRAIRYGNSGGHLLFIDTAAVGGIDPTNSEALAASADGSVVVGWGVFSGLQRAFRWTEAGNMVILTPAAGIANGVSGDGSIVVGDFAVPLSGRRHAFRWTAGTGLVDLGTLPGMTASVAYAISTDGQTIVGKSYNPSVFNAQRAFIWRADLGMQDLNTVLAAVKPAGFTFTEARAINSAATVIAGGSITPTGGVEAWVATLPGCVAPSVVSGPDIAVSGSAATIDLAVGGFGPFAYQWRKDGQDLPGATSSSLFVSNSAADAGAYDCVVSGPCGSATSGAAILTPPSCPADFNLDGVVDPDDLSDFIGAFFQAPPAPAADFNKDGVTDPDDLSDFIGAFFGGC